MPCTAITEMERLRGASAWSPLAPVVRRTANGACTRYTFADTSALTVFDNGDAAWFHRDAQGRTVGEQRWPQWHRCTARGRS